VIVGVVGALVLRSRSRPPIGAARTVGASAGVMFGLQDALTRRTLSVLPHGAVATLFEQWPTYALIVVGACSIFLAQSAFEAGPLPASLPLLTFGEPVTGIAFGAGVYSEHLSLSPASLVAEIVCLAGAAVGVWLVAAAPTLSARPEGGQH
jgi:hypothetical protein